MANETEAKVEASEVELTAEEVAASGKLIGRAWGEVAYVDAFRSNSR